jgi:hypothetical protein
MAGTGNDHECTGSGGEISWAQYRRELVDAEARSPHRQSQQAIFWQAMPWLENSLSDRALDEIVLLRSRRKGGEQEVCVSFIDRVAWHKMN